jgi:diguanylate cyclase (GGDEF)-like protein/PAS domain S-box-containing protein
MSESVPAALLQLIVDRINVGIFTVDRQMRLVQWNHFMALNTGKSASEVLGKNLFECFPELPRAWLQRKLDSVFVLENFAFVSWRQRPYVFAFQHNRPVTGGIDWMRQDGTFFPVRDEKGAVNAVTAALYDATDVAVSHRQFEDANRKLHDAMTELERLSNTDALTGVYNRRHLQQQLELEISRVRRYGGSLSLIVFDLDHFKRVNDSFGHLGGDAVLRFVAERVGSSIRDLDVFARYGGEEFCLALPATQGDGAVQLAERLRRMLEREPAPFDGKLIPFTVSLGVSEMAPDIHTPAELFERADRALYQSKTSGRNRVTRFSPVAAPAEGAEPLSLGTP